MCKKVEHTPGVSSTISGTSVLYRLHILILVFSRVRDVSNLYPSSHLCPNSSTALKSVKMEATIEPSLQAVILVSPITLSSVDMILSSEASYDF